MSAADRPDAFARREAAMVRVEALAIELAGAIREALVADAEMYRDVLRSRENSHGLPRTRDRIRAALRCLQTAQEPR